MACHARRRLNLSNLDALALPAQDHVALQNDRTELLRMEMEQSHSLEYPLKISLENAYCPVWETQKALPCVLAAPGRFQSLPVHERQRNPTVDLIAAEHPSDYYCAQ